MNEQVERSSPMGHIVVPKTIAEHDMLNLVAAYENVAVLFTRAWDAVLHEPKVTALHTALQDCPSAPAYPPGRSGSRTVVVVIVVVCSM
jgi:hypothetical protein